MAKWYIHVNKNVIQKNAKRNEKDPVIRIQKGIYGTPSYAFDVAIPDGSVFRYSPDNPILPCGAKLVIECPSEPVILA